MDINQKQKERLEQQFAFIREIDKEKFIGRQTYLTDGERKENDAEKKIIRRLKHELEKAV